jgi:sulfotransferase family protein
MLKASPLPPEDQLTERARSFAYPDLTAAAREAIAASAPRAAGLAIEPAALMAAARERTGFQDFGSAPLVEPLTALCRSLNDELELHALGRVYLWEQLVGLLSTRLRLEELWRRHPEILDLPVERPVIVIGLPRSGTTILHRLLARDPAKRSSPFWEQVMPLPLGAPDAEQEDPDPRIAVMQRSVDTLYTMAPDMVAMHEVLVEEPDEDITQLIFAFASLQFEWSYRVPGYSRIYQATDQTEGYRYFRRVLQTLQWLRGGERWVLKAPQHLEQLGPLMAVFPDAVFVQTHRDPVPAVISLASLTTYGSRRYFDHPNPHATGAHIASIVERLLRKGVDDRPADDSRFVDIAFADLVADPIGCVRRIYAAAGDELSPEAEAAMSAWIADNRQAKHGRHEYAAEDFGLDVADLRQRFRFYQERFGIPDDPRFMA